MQKSDLSGKPIASEAASEVELRLPDGRRTRLVVQAAEADELATKGRPVPSVLAWIPRWVRKTARLVAKWALVSVVGVLVVQALGKQVADRQKELELKRSLTSDLGSSSYEAFAQARSLAYLPEDQRSPARRLEILTAWISNEGRLDGAFRTYLPKRNHAVSNQWRDFRNGFYTYLRLACCESEAERATRLHEIDGYLRAQGAIRALPPTAAVQWRALQRGPSYSPYADAYDWLGRELLRFAPYRGIEKSTPEGFSSGFGDFLHDAIPVY